MLWKLKYIILAEVFFDQIQIWILELRPRGLVDPVRECVSFISGPHFGENQYAFKELLG